MLGQPVSMLIPRVVGFKLTGELTPGTTATDEKSAPPTRKLHLGPPALLYATTSDHGKPPVGFGISSTASTVPSNSAIGMALSAKKAPAVGADHTCAPVAALKAKTLPGSTTGRPPPPGAE